MTGLFFLFVCLFSIYFDICFLFTWLCWVFAAARGIFDHPCKGDLIPWPGIKPRSPSLGARSLSHWTARNVRVLIFIPRSPIAWCSFYMWEICGLWMNDTWCLCLWSQPLQSYTWHFIHFKPQLSSKAGSTAEVSPFEKLRPGGTEWIAYNLTAKLITSFYFFVAVSRLVKQWV